MRILFGKIALAAGSTEGPSGWRLVHVRQVQSTAYIRAPYAAHYPRKNVTHEIAFTVTREHATLRAALQHILDHPASLPDQDTLQFIEDSDGGGVVRRWIRDAVLNRCELLAQRGVSTTWAYNLIGGEILTRDPAIHPSAGEARPAFS